MNIGCITILVLTSGGGRLSPFTPLYGVMPVIAIFLREPIYWTVLYVAGCIVAFSLSMLIGTVSDHSEHGKRRDPVAFWFVTVSTIALAALIGIVTSPRPIAIL